MLQATKLTGGNNPLTGNDYELEGNCGYFERNIEWTIPNNNQHQREGIIFQLIKRTMAVQRYDQGNWVVMSNTEVDAYVGAQLSPKMSTYDLYWEAWVVKKGDLHPSYSFGRNGRADDCFSLTAIIPPQNHASATFRNTTKGSYTIRGAAFFMSTDLEIEEDFGFSLNPSCPASRLHSHLALGRHMFPGMRADSDVVKHTVTVSWDSSVDGGGDGYGVTNIDEDSLVTLNSALFLGKSMTPAFK